MLVATKCCISQPYIMLITRFYDYKYVNNVPPTWAQCDDYGINFILKISNQCLCNQPRKQGKRIYFVWLLSKRYFPAFVHFQLCLWWVKSTSLPFCPDKLSWCQTKLTFNIPVKVKVLHGPWRWRIGGGQPGARGKHL